MPARTAFSSLIQVSELAGQIPSDDWAVIDCRFDLSRPEAGHEAYQAGHVPGAIYAHLDRDLAGPRRPGSGRHPLPDPGTLAATFSRWGIGSDTRVVAYDDAGGAIAARLWWLLRWMGHRSVALLDGGWAAWVAAGMTVADEIRSPLKAHFSGKPGHMPTMETRELETRLQDPALLLLDARARARYLGDQEPIDPVAGHVPGAKNLPFLDSLTREGRFRGRDELRRIMEPVFGGREGRGITVMCGSGVTACHNIFSMELAGFPGARLYPGSWSEWITDPRRPVARR